MSKTGYPSDLTDPQWARVEPAFRQRRDGRGAPQRHERRAIVNAIFYRLRTGCAWRYLPRDFPAWRTVYGYFQAWQRDGTLERLHASLRAAVREQEERPPQPSAGSLDSQTAKSTEKGGSLARLGMTEANGSKDVSASC